MKKICWLVLSMLCWTSFTYAQESTPDAMAMPVETVPAVFAEFTTTVTMTRLGDPFVLMLTVRVPDGITLDTWPVPDDTFAPLAIISSETRTLSQRESEIVYQQAFIVVLWNTGAYTTPEARVVYTRSNQRFYAPVQSVTLTVVPQIADLSQAVLRPSLPLIDVAVLSPLVAAGAGSAVVIVLWLIVRRRRPQDRRSPAGRTATLIIAQLEDIQHSALSTEEAILLAVERLRAYLTTQMQVNAADMTTGETVRSLHDQRLLPKSLISGLSTLLEQADLIKFANLSPSVSTHQFIRAAIRWVKQTDSALAGLYG